MGALSAVFSVFRRRVESLEEPPYPVFDSKVIFLPEEDGEEEQEHQLQELTAKTRQRGVPASEGDLEPVTIHMVYVDSKNQESQRTVTCLKIKEFHGSYCLMAKCHKRNATRSFRIDRIKEITEYGTKPPKTHSPPDDFLQDLMEFAGLSTGDPLKARVRQAMQLCGDGLTLLTFLARCDGFYHPHEEEAIEQYCIERCEDDADDELIGALIEHSRLFFPSPEQFLDAAESVFQGDDEPHARRLLHFVRAVTEADGVISPEEFEWRRELEDCILQYI